MIACDDSGAAGAVNTWSPLSWRIAKVRRSSGSVSADSSRITSAIVCLGSRLSSVATPPNWKEKSTSTTLSGLFAAAAVATFTATVVVPTPPFGL